MTSRGYMTQEEFDKLNKFSFNSLHWLYGGSGWSLADPSKGLDPTYEAFEGTWTEYFNKYLACGALPDSRGIGFMTKDRGCGARDWKMESLGYPQLGGHRVRCNNCGLVNDVLVIAEEREND